MADEQSHQQPAHLEPLGDDDDIDFAEEHERTSTDADDESDDEPEAPSGHSGVKPNKRPN